MEEIQVISGKIQQLPGRPPFMVDRDLAVIYETRTDAINQAVKRNSERFPGDFCFKLTREETGRLGELHTDCVEFEREKHRPKKYLPYAFTREGCNMLSAVLSTDIAIARSIQIMRAFSAMERGQGTDVAIVGRVMELGATVNRAIAQTARLAERIDRLEERLSQRLDKIEKRIWAMYVLRPKELNIDELETRLVARMELERGLNRERF